MVSASPVIARDELLVFAVAVVRFPLRPGAAGDLGLVCGYA
jgi:hypothetical protein